MNVNTYRIKLITAALQNLNPTHLQVLDESDKHIGHEGAKSGLGHFKIIIKSDEFIENKLYNHKLIYAALGPLMKTDIHAIKISIIK
jgi:BolA family transcriptional regulator, general stress-responsive regulator